MKNKFITFEGIDGSGKTTQIKLLKEYLSNIGVNVLITREPGGSAISEKIRNLLLDVSNKKMLPETEMLLYMASRSQHVGELILPAMYSGKTVICDRFYDSTIAYQGAARNINIDIINTVQDYVSYGLVPDLTILIDLPVEVGLVRILNRDADRIEKEPLQFLKKVRQKYLDLAKAEPNRFIIINGNQDVENIRKEIINKVIKRIM